jgi:adenylate kinase
MFIGKPGSGKDTVSKKLHEKYDWPLIVTGDLLREEVKKGTELGKMIAPILARGEIVDDEIVAKIIVERLKSLESEVILLNGYPRTIGQAKILEEKLQETQISKSIVIELEVSDQTVLDRLTLRRICPKCGKIYNLKFSPPKEDEICDVCKEKLIQRDDDKEDVIKYRLKRFYDEIDPIRDFYKEKDALIVVDGEKKIEEVVDEVEKIIMKFLE